MSADKIVDVEMTPVVEKKEKKSKKDKKAKKEESESKKRPSPTEEAEQEAEEPKKKKSKKEKKEKKEEVVEEVAATTAESEEEKEVEVVAEVAEVAEEKVEEEAAPASKTVYIGGLPFSATEEQVKKDFEECGEIVSFRFPMNSYEGTPKGFAFAEFATAEAVKKALEYNETDYGGRTIYVRVDDNAEKGKGKKGKDGKGKGKGKDGKGKGSFNMQPGEKPEGCSSIIVKNMSFETTEDTIRSAFEGFGEISRINCMTNEETGMFRGMCFIDYTTTEAVDQAITLCNTDMDGRLIFVDFAGAKPAKGKDGKGKGKGKDGKKGGKKGDGKKGKGKGKKGSDPSYAARNGAPVEFSGTTASFDSDSE